MIRGVWAVHPAIHNLLLPFEIYEILQHFVRSSDDLGISLEAPLRNNHVRKLLGKIHVGHFQRSGGYATAAPAVGGAYLRKAGIV